MNRSLPLLALASAGLITLSACGSGGSSSAADQSTQPGTGGYGSASGGGGFGPGGRMPGTFGKIAAKTGRTLQVQGADGQVAVTFTAKTAITQQVTVAEKAVKVGTCVMVTPSEDSISGSATDDTGNDAVIAGTVRITAGTQGSCSGGATFGGRPGSSGPSGNPSGMPSGMPSGAPSDLGSGGPGGGRRMFGTAGKVTAVTDDGFTVKETTPGSDDTTDVTVTVTGDTTVTTTKNAAASVLEVGKCVSATGDSDDTGAVTADRISVTDPVDGECTGGFVRRRGASQ